MGSTRPSVSHAASNPIAIKTAIATAATAGASVRPAATIGYIINHQISTPGARNVRTNTQAAIAARAAITAGSGRTTRVSSVRSAAAGACQIVSHEYANASTARHATLPPSRAGERPNVGKCQTTRASTSTQARANQVHSLGSGTLCGGASVMLAIEFGDSSLMQRTRMDA